jgi:hypothetical protein
MLFFVVLVQGEQIRDTPGLGFHSYEVPARTPLLIQNPDAQNRIVMSWSGDADDDPSVLIMCTLWGVEYIHRPLLSNFVFPVGEIVQLRSDAVLRVQVWVLPIHFCAPTTFFYSAAHLVSNEFTLTENVVNGLCLFFNSASKKNRIIAEIKSKKVDYSESRVEIINSNFELLKCKKERCEQELGDRFFVRFVGAKTGLRLLVEAFFEHSDLLGACTRNSVPVWDGNLSYTVDLHATNEEFICDEPVLLARKRQKKWLFLAFGFLLSIFAIFSPFDWRRVVHGRPDRVPVQLQDLPKPRRRMAKT